MHEDLFLQTFCISKCKQLVSNIYGIWLCAIPIKESPKFTFILIVKRLMDCSTAGKEVNTFQISVLIYSKSIVYYSKCFFFG